MYESESIKRKPVQVSYQLWYVLYILRRALKVNYKIDASFSDILCKLIIKDEKDPLTNCILTEFDQSLKDKLYPKEVIRFV